MGKPLGVFPIIDNDILVTTNQLENPKVSTVLLPYDVTYIPSINYNYVRKVTILQVLT